jgi:hypothetical protein
VLAPQVQVVPPPIAPSRSIASAVAARRACVLAAARRRATLRGRSDRGVIRELAG